MKKILEIKMHKDPCNSIFGILDLYNKDFPLRIFGKQKYTTKGGTVLGAISIVAIIVFSLFLLLELFARKSVMVVYNKNTNILPFIDLTNAAFMVAVTDKIGRKIPIEGVYNLEIKMLNYYIDKDKLMNELNATNIEFEVCNIEKHNKTYGSLFKEMQYDAFYCVELGQQNKTLYGKLGDFPNGFSLMGVYVNRCEPKRQKCLDDSIVEKYLSDFVVGITYSSYTVDHYNYNTPNIPKNENNGVFPMTFSLLKCYFYNLAQVIYETDYGLIFEEKKVMGFYEFESQTVDVNMPGTITNFLFASESTVGYILFKCSENISFFYRSYGKAQAVIANIGGLIKAMLVATKLIFDFFTRKCVMVDLANTFFEFSNEDSISQKISFKKSNLNIENDNKIINIDNKNGNKSLTDNNDIVIKNSNKNKSDDNNLNELSNINNNKKKEKNFKNEQERRNSFSRNNVQKLDMRSAISAASQNSIKKLKLNDLRTKDRNFPNKPKDIGLSKFEWILPNVWVRKHNNIKILNLCEKIINKKLSVETVFHTSHKIEFLANSILNDSQIKEYKDNNKISLDLNNKDKNKIKYILNVSKFDLNENLAQNFNVLNVSNDNAILLNKRNMSNLQ